MGWKSWLALVALVGAVAGAGFVLVTEVFDPGEDSPPADSDQGPGGSGGDSLVIRALGDSVTAGFGYSADGTKISVGELPNCAAHPSNPNCQDPDGVAYPARFAARHSGSDFQNLAESGSIPADYLGEGRIDRRPDLDAVVEADPDVTVLTIGANPLLQSFLLGSDRYCATTVSVAAARSCVRRALLREQVVPRLTRIYTALLDTPSDGRNGKVIVFQYPETHPASAFGIQLKVLIEELRSTIAGAAAAARTADPGKGERLLVADPGPFLQHGCLSQVPWILRVDTCIHPNIAGHVQLANVLDGLLPPEPG
jgi:lysophospholipase L1-like esterase